MQGKVWGTVSPANPHLTYCKGIHASKPVAHKRCVLPLRCEDLDGRTPVPLSQTIVKYGSDSSLAGAGIGQRLGIGLYTPR